MRQDDVLTGAYAELRSVAMLGRSNRGGRGRGFRSPEMLRRFATEYLRNGGNAAAAVKTLGSKAKSAQALAVIGGRVLRASRATGLLQQRLAEVESAERMAADEVIVRLSRLARADIGQHLRWGEDGEPYLRIDPAHTDTIRELRQRDGPPNGDKAPAWVERMVKVADPRPALEALARIHGLDGKQPPEKPAINVNNMRQTFIMLLKNMR